MFKKSTVCRWQAKDGFVELDPDDAWIEGYFSENSTNPHPEGSERYQQWELGRASALGEKEEE